jgi:hypothetical protein
MGESRTGRWGEPARMESGVRERGSRGGDGGCNVDANGSVEMLDCRTLCPVRARVTDFFQFRPPPCNNGI